MGRVNDALAQEVRELHFSNCDMMVSDEEIILDLKDAIHGYKKLLVLQPKLEGRIKDLESMLVVEQGLSQFAIDLRENYYDAVGYTDNLNEVFDYYTSKKPIVSLKLSKEDFESIRNDTYRKIKADLLESLGGCN